MWFYLTWIQAKGSDENIWHVFEYSQVSTHEIWDKEKKKGLP